MIELASFRAFSEIILQFLDQLTETIGVVLSTIIANVRTEQLLQQSQSQAQELQKQSQALQTQQEELQETNEELQEKAEQLERQNRDIEIKNREIEMARALARGEGGAAGAELEVQVRVPREHVARAAHAAQLAADPVEGAQLERDRATCTSKQVDSAATIHNAGSDLLALINDILDLSKVEAGKMDVHPGRTSLAAVRDFVERSFRSARGGEGPVASRSSSSPRVPGSIETDEQRLQQVLKNLLSNAFKFTERGSVKLSVGAGAGRDAVRGRGARARRARRRVLASATAASGSRRTSCA